MKVPAHLNQLCPYLADTSEMSREELHKVFDVLLDGKTTFCVVAGEDTLAVTARGAELAADLLAAQEQDMPQIGGRR